MLFELMEAARLAELHSIPKHDGERQTILIEASTFGLIVIGIYRCKKDLTFEQRHIVEWREIDRNARLIEMGVRCIIRAMDAQAFLNGEEPVRPNATAVQS